MSGTLFVVPTPIGNLEDITLRALRVLREATLVAAEDTRSARHLLEHHQITGKKIISYFEGNEAFRSDELVRRIGEGESIALVSEAGMPGISDPGARVIAAVREANLRVEVLPGPSAAITALVGSGLPTDRFLFIGFPSRQQGERLALFGSLRNEPGTIIFYEAPGRVGVTLADLASALGDRRAEVARELSKVFEERIAGTLPELATRFAETAPRGECVIIVEGSSNGEAIRDIDIESDIRARLARGERPKEIAAALVLLTGKKRRELYQLVIALEGSGV